MIYRKNLYMYAYTINPTKLYLCELKQIRIHAACFPYSLSYANKNVQCVNVTTINACLWVYAHKLVINYILKFFIYQMNLMIKKKQIKKNSCYLNIISIIILPPDIKLDKCWSHSLVKNFLKIGTLR